MVSILIVSISLSGASDVDYTERCDGDRITRAATEDRIYTLGDTGLVGDGDHVTIREQTYDFQTIGEYETNMETFQINPTDQSPSSRVRDGELIIPGTEEVNDNFILHVDTKTNTQNRIYLKDGAEPEDAAWLKSGYIGVVGYISSDEPEFIAIYTEDGDEVARFDSHKIDGGSASAYTKNRIWIDYNDTGTVALAPDGSVLKREDGSLIPTPHGILEYDGDSGVTNLKTGQYWNVSAVRNYRETVQYRESATIGNYTYVSFIDTDGPQDKNEHYLLKINHRNTSDYSLRTTKRTGPGRTTSDVDRVGDHVYVDMPGKRVMVDENGTEMSTSELAEMGTGIGTRYLVPQGPGGTCTFVPVGEDITGKIKYNPHELFTNEITGTKNGSVTT